MICREDDVGFCVGDQTLPWISLLNFMIHSAYLWKWFNALYDLSFTLLSHFQLYFLLLPSVIYQSKTNTANFHLHSTLRSSIFHIFRSSVSIQVPMTINARNTKKPFKKRITFPWKYGPLKEPCRTFEKYFPFVKAVVSLVASAKSTICVIPNRYFFYFLCFGLKLFDNTN